MSNYFVDGELTLPNKLGIEDPEELKRAEEEIVSARMVELMSAPATLPFDFNRLKWIHKKLFSDIYDFAGKVRAVRIAKEDSVFCYPEYIENSQKEIFSHLEKENYLVGLPRQAFLVKFAKLADDLNALHPFREGNGRAIRLFLKQLAEHADWYVAYEDMDGQELLDANIKAFKGDLKPLIQILDQHLIFLNMICTIEP